MRMACFNFAITDNSKQVNFNGATFHTRNLPHHIQKYALDLICGRPATSNLL